MDALSSDDERRCRDAEALAARLVEEARATMGPRERRRRRRIAAAVTDDTSRAFLLELTDQVLRIRTPRRAAARLADLVRTYPSPAMAGPADRVALQLAGILAPIAPAPVVALATARLRRELAGLVLPAEAAPLRRHLRRRRAEGMRLNVNLLGEAVLGERQARERARLVTGLLGRREVDCISVKLSALYSQLDVVAYEHSLHEVRERLRPILEAAARHDPPKLVNLDMEEYRDLQVTVDAFTSLLGDGQLLDLYAGIALQAYLPDATGVLEQLCAFARDRRARGGAPIRVRLVKGANLAMERVEAELRGWEQAPYPTKAEVDANYKRMLDLALRPENAGAVRIGVASHNLFDVAWALTLGRECGDDRVEIEMLEGMAVAEAKAVARVAGGVLLYAPVVRRDDFESAVAYLVRRFDENTEPENFLAHVAELEPGSDAWEDQRQRFRRAVADRLRPAGSPRRRPTLGTPGPAEARTPAGTFAGAEQPFANAADTDFSVPANRAVLAEAMRALAATPPPPVPALVGGEVVEGPLTGTGIDPSAPESEWYRYVQADMETVERAVAVARRAAPAWASTPGVERRRLLHAVAARIEADRARTIAVMAADSGKVVREGDVEVSEAVDGARYYGDQAVVLESLHGRDGRFSPFGVVVVAPPWNFPYAIPSGGVFAALAAGNAVILKPAPETVLTASSIVAHCHEAGIPKDVVQFVPCADAETGRRLVTHPDVGAVILTGAYDTARRFLEWRPDLRLHAETSGKNSIVVTAAADQEDAVRDIVHSAFSHAGQKCSAASLAILEAPVYDDPRFCERLADAVESLRVGSPFDLSTRIGPLIRPPAGPLERALSTLGPRERWLVEPRQVGDNPQLWSPGVKLGVEPGSEFHLTECFGPVLGLLRARDLDHALELQNATPYGLTGGISTLDTREADRWTAGVAVGNAYVNRPITGAIVRRQPFGGWKRSSVGPGAKTGGPHYVATLGHWRRTGPADLAAETARARTEGRRLRAGVDPSGLRAERNVFRLHPLGSAALRIGADHDPDELAVSLAVSADLGLDLRLSVAAYDPKLPAATVVEDDATFVERMRRERPDRVRLGSPAPALRLALLDAGLEVDVEPLVGLGTYELLRWTREQAVSTTNHRHGNVVMRPARRAPHRATAHRTAPLIEGAGT
ncbi:MAG: proline dehydrogenase family protein [Actinomycetota bacterium]|jgi:RHH-type proline utilization regulon transcriptional repressor/proline dehydrogenase/delta 1-pyrroline-5-carboxylate dehydrogenase|nr:proline dehydrogenase family protein [Actinomycetota bacterium]